MVDVIKINHYLFCQKIENCQTLIPNYTSPNHASETLVESNSAQRTVTSEIFLEIAKFINGKDLLDPNASNESLCFCFYRLIRWVLWRVPLWYRLPLIRLYKSVYCESFTRSVTGIFRFLYKQFESYLKTIANRVYSIIRKELTTAFHDNEC